MGREYVAVHPTGYGYGYWGSGTSIEEAKANLKANGGKLNRVAVWELPEGAIKGFMNDWSQISWEWDPEFTGEKIHKANVVYKRGVKLDADRA